MSADSMRSGIRSLLRGYAAVLFGGDPRLGAVLLAVTLTHPASGVGALLAAATANATAHLLGYRADSVQAGIYGYNALLLGLAVMAGRALDGNTAMLLALAGAAAALLTAVLGDALQRGFGLPVLALPFVLLGSLLAPALDTFPQDPAAAWLTDRAWLELKLPLPEPLLRVLEGFGAIFFHPQADVGLVVLGVAAAISRIGAVTMIAGAVVAGGVAQVIDPAPSAVLMRAAIYNGALSGATIGAFLFIPGRAALVAGMGAAALSGWLTVALSALCLRWGLPLLAWPFVLVTLAMLRALHLRAPDRPPFPSALPGQSPEANLDYVATLAGRFGLPGAPEFLLPVEGVWTVTQGVNGGVTHRDAWSHAWDFELLDESGFPFRGDGTRPEDYRCFGQPVLAAGAGTVAAVHDGQPDGQPGALDTVHPWGNTVVVQHGPELFSVLAHLQCGSILVKPGQFVAAGTPVAACGASGRSPRAHLHFQVQRTVRLGDATLPCRIVHYVEIGRDGQRSYQSSGLPREGSQVSRRTPHPLADAFAVLTPGQEIELRIEGGGRLRWRSEVSLLGERSLVDLDRGERLWFTTAHGDLAFTTLHGARGNPLWALFVALPRLPSERMLPVQYVDHPPAALLLEPGVRWLHDAVRFVHDPIETRAEIELRAEGPGLLCVESRSGVGWRGHCPRRYRGRVEIDAQGLRGLELWDEQAPDRPLLRARRAGADLAAEVGAAAIQAPAMAGATRDAN